MSMYTYTHCTTLNCSCFRGHTKNVNTKLVDEVLLVNFNLQPTNQIKFLGFLRSALTCSDNICKWGDHSLLYENP